MRRNSGVESTSCRRNTGTREVKEEDREEREEEGRRGVEDEEV